MKPGRLRAVRWTEASIVFQGAMHALNPVQRVGEQIAEAILLHQQAGEREAESAWARCWSRSGCRPPDQGLPPRALRRPEAAGDDRHGAGLQPALIIADEPTTALDVMVQAQVLKLLKELQRDLGLAMLFITHDLSVLVEVCDRLAIMYAGRIVEEGPAEAVFDDPRRTPTPGRWPGVPRDRRRAVPARTVGPARRPARPADLPSGCTFHPRCPVAFEACPDIDPDAVRRRAAIGGPRACWSTAAPRPRGR